MTVPSRSVPPPSDDGRERSLDSGLDETPDLTKSMRLVRRAQEGDRIALEDLFRRYDDRVRRIARIRMGPRIRSLLETADLVQNTYAVALRKIGDLELRSHASIIQWMARILEHQIHDAQKYFDAEKRDHGKRVFLEEMTPSDTTTGGYEPADAEPRPLDQLAQREIQELYDEAVSELEGDMREVVTLREHASADWNFIARELGRPSVGAAQELYRRARMRLAERLRRRIQE